MQESYSNTERLILEAAEREFLERGFAGARTTSIASAAGVTHAMLHYYFRTKELLFEKVLDQKMDVLVRSIIDSFLIVQDDDTFLGKIANIISAHYRFVAANAGLPLFLLNEVLNTEERRNLLVSKVRSKALTVATRLDEQMREAVEKGEICEIDLLTLVVDIASLNLFSVIAKPLVQPLSGMSDDDYNEWRREENVRTILKRLSKA